MNITKAHQRALGALVSLWRSAICISQFLLAVLLSLCVLPCLPQVPPKAVQEQRWFLYPIGGETPIKLEVLASEPARWNGKVVVINHGSTGRGHGSNGYDDSRVKATIGFVKLNSILVDKGYRTFVLMRKGRGNSEGKFTEEDPRTCAWADQMRGVAEAEPQLDKFIDWLRAEYKITKVIVMGHSRGGFLSSYYAARHPDKVSLAVNLSGGWTTVCEGKNRMTYLMLKDSAEKFKSQAWVYAGKDTYFTDAQINAYESLANQAGIKFIKLETVSGDGHAVATAHPDRWVGQVEQILEH